MLAVREMYRVLRQGGVAVATVPTHMWLYSAFDRVVKHRRGRPWGRLKRLLEGAGFCGVKCTYFFSLLLPVVAVYRFAYPFFLRWFSDGRRLEKKVSIVLLVPALVNKMAIAVYSADGRVVENIELKQTQRERTLAVGKVWALQSVECGALTMGFCRN